MVEKLIIKQATIHARSLKVAQHIEQNFKNTPVPLGDVLWVYGVPRGGVPAAYAVMTHLDKRRWGITGDVTKADVLIDDIIVTGATRERYVKMAPRSSMFVTLFNEADVAGGKWLVFPWDQGPQGDDSSADDIVLRLLEFIGEDPNREGLSETPRRFLAAWQEWCSGYGVDPSELLKCFEDGAQNVDEMVIVGPIDVHSKCEHHLADIIGKAWVGYIPQGKVVGLSKIARVVDAFAHRLQVQERLTNEIADCIHEGLGALGTAVLIRAEHHCMSTRGVKAHGSRTVTSAVRGAIKDEPEARAEFLALATE